MLGRIFKGLGIVVLLVVAAIAALFGGARLHDGPLGPIPGGSLASGELVSQPPSDWAFAKDVPEIEMQLAYENTSRTTWVLVRDGVAYIPCSLTTPPGKTWYKHADENGAAIVRIAGKRYPVTLHRVTDEPTRQALGQVAVAKYPQAARVSSGGAWFFQIEPRTEAAS
ncbi:MAG TPA: hypothetical protein VMR50_03425 [Myxococcota bacterium]|nr:hypothetical protein [Myxococcota bacterium]